MKITNWFTGVVEDVADPLQQGRVRVRCFGYHSSSTSDIPTSDLPWATCVMPVTSPAMAGIGASPTGLMPGSWVCGVFRDGNESQDPLVIGSLASMSGPASGPGGAFGDPHGTYPIIAGADIPAGATTYGYSNNEGFRNGMGGPGSFNTAAVGAGSPTSSFYNSQAPIAVNGNVSSIIARARGEIGVVETSTNQGPGIAKYWAATTYTSGYSARAPWCAAFVSWCVQAAGIFSENDRPKSAAAYRGGGYEAWARSKSNICTLSISPRSIRTGDIVIFSFSHIGIATSDSDASGKFSSIEGNTDAAGSREGNGVWEKRRSLAVVRSSITITSSSGSGGVQVPSALPPSVSAPLPPALPTPSALPPALPTGIPAPARPQTNIFGAPLPVNPPNLVPRVPGSLANLS